MFRKIILLLLLFVSIIGVSAENLNNLDYIKVDIQNSIEFGVEFENNYKVNALFVDNFFYPQTYNNSQYLNDFTTSQSNYNIIEEIDNYYIRYDLTNSLEEENNIENQFTIQSTVDRPKISNIISYPPENVKKEYEQYLEFEGLITIDDEIRKQATQLAQGEDDAYVIASKVAKWIREDINYDLSTITENPDQTSTQVFQSKAGVCKEITHLYISMMRSLGIPARVVTGYAFTNSQEVIDFVGSPWGGHAWAEVLIGDKWVPFDLTYNQYGFVDSTHIVLDKSAAIRPNTVTVNGSGYGFSFVDNSLSTQTDFEVVEKKEELFERGFSLDIDGPQELAPNSYGYLNATITNSKDFYQVLFLKVAKTQEIELISQPQQMLIFKPKESKQLLLTYKIPQLDENYVYTFPFLLYNDFLEEEFKLNVKKDALSLTQEELPEIKEKKVAFSNKNIEMSCIGSFEIPENSISCSLKNPNNYEVKNSKVCLDNNCETLNFLINEEKYIDFKTPEFRPEVIFKYGDERVTEKIIIDKPSFDASVKLVGDVVNAEVIHNSDKDLNFVFIINDKEVASKTQKEVDFSYKLEPGNHSLTIMLKDPQRTFDSYTAQVLVEEQGIINKIINFFKNLF